MGAVPAEKVERSEDRLNPFRAPATSERFSSERDGIWRTGTRTASETYWGVWPGHHRRVGSPVQFSGGCRSGGSAMLARAEAA